MGQHLVLHQQQQQHRQQLSDEESNPDLENQSENENGGTTTNDNASNNVGVTTTLNTSNNEILTGRGDHAQLLFGGAPMIIDGLLNQEFFSNSNSEELMNLFGYYGGVEGLLGASGGDNTIHGGGGDQQPTFRKFEFKETMLLRNDVSIQKNNILLVKCNQDNHYQLSFKFNVRSSYIEECKVFVYLKAREIMVDGRVAYVSMLSSEIPSKSFHQQDFVIAESLLHHETRVDLNNERVDTTNSVENTRKDYNESAFVEYTLNDILIDFKNEFPNREDLQYYSNPSQVQDDETELQSQLIPLVIVLSCDTSTQYSLCSLDYQSNDQTYAIKVNKQKIVVGNELFEVGEIYQQSTNDHHHQHQEEENLCVVCISEEANTVVLPCGHMSLCEGCAIALKEQTNKCPICRQKVESAIKLPSKEE